MREFLRRLDYLLHRRRFDRELAADLEFHREMSARAGAPPVNALLLRESARDAWGWTWIDRFAQDLRYAARMMRRSPGFTLAAVLMLALGIGVNVALFGYFDRMVLRPLPVRDPATLLQFNRSSPLGYADNLPYPEVSFFRENVRSLSAVMAQGFARLTINDDRKQVDARFVTANIFSELGAKGGLGRMLDPARDEAPAAPPVVVLSYRFWERSFGADPSVVGSAIRVNGKPATVVGIAPSNFCGFGLDQSDLWVPLAQRPYFVPGQSLADFSDTGITVFMWGRLKPGQFPRAAEAELQSLAAELHRRHPAEIWDKETLPSLPGGFALRLNHEMIPILALAATLCLLILAVACGNLGSLLLARGVAREREISIRVAVGAGRTRLVRQLFTESLLLAVLGSLAGLALGYTVLRLLAAATGLPPWLSLAPDGRVLVFVVSMGIAAAILFGLTPALQAARQRHRAHFMRQLLIGAQVAASCVLLIVAGLLVRAMDHAMYADPGFDFQHVITIDPAFAGYTPARAASYFDVLESRLRAVSGVQSVSLVSNPPLGNRWTFVSTQIGGHTVNVHYNHIDPPFFETMQIPLLRGRTLSPGEDRAIVVSDSLARLQWPNTDPLGKSFRIGTEDHPVVGVARSARLVSPEDSDAVEVYQLAAPTLLPAMVVLVRTAGAPEALLPVAASIARAVDPKLFPEAQMMKDAYRGYQRTAGYSALTATLLGLLALLLACTGIVGLVNYAVSQRIREIGIRVALGARAGQVLAVVLRRFFIPVGAGLLLGVGGAIVLSQVLRRLLYGVSNLDPVAYLAAMGVFLIAVALAGIVPARRALRVDPIKALHYD